MYLFWKVRQFSAIFLLLEYYSNEADTDNRLCHTLQLIFPKVAVCITGKKKKKKASDYSHHEDDGGDDDGDNDMPQFFWGL